MLVNCGGVEKRMPYFIAKEYDEKDVEVFELINLMAWITFGILSAVMFICNSLNIIITKSFKNP